MIKKCAHLISMTARPKAKRYVHGFRMCYDNPSTPQCSLVLDCNSSTLDQHRSRIQKSCDTQIAKQFAPAILCCSAFQVIPVNSSV